MLVEQHARDARAGRTSPRSCPATRAARWAGSTRPSPRCLTCCGEHGITFVPGLNEELAATSVWGSQPSCPAGTATHDGVIGVWYGKAPGLDRATDALRHANMYGANPRGGVLLLVGDDPAAKSSTLPCVSERSLAALASRCSTRATPRRSSRSAYTAWRCPARPAVGRH